MIAIATAILKSFLLHNASICKKSLHTNTVTNPKSALRFPLTSLQCGAILQSLTNNKSIAQGRKLHACMLTSGNLQNNTYLSSKLAAFYAACGRMIEAQVIFDGVALKNSFLWNFMIRGYASGGVIAYEALAMYRKMLRLGIVDNFTFPFVLKACGDLGLSEMGREIHTHVEVCGWDSDIYVNNSLLAMYLKFGNLDVARKVFDKMPDRDTTSWNTLISGYVRNNNAMEALMIFYLMGKAGLKADGTTLLALLSACVDLAAIKQGKEIHCYAIRNNYVSSNEFLMNSLIDMYSNCSSIAVARQLFEELKIKDTVSWNSIISCYQRSGDAFESLRLFCQMLIEETAAPDEITLVAVLGACEKITALQFGKSVHSYLTKIGIFLNSFLGTALIDMYAKCGELSCSYHVFCEMTQKNMVAWSAMIAAYGIHGRGKEAISVFNEMTANGISPDEGVLTSVLSACSHSGLVDEGKTIFNEMTIKYDIRPGPAHYLCLVDLLGRAGLLNEAYELVKRMEVEPSADIWAALLSACRLHRNVVLAEISAQNIFRTNPTRVSSYICLSNIYAAMKQWTAVEKVRTTMRNYGLKKPAGYSLIELDSQVHMFFVGDKSHQQTKDIYAKLKDISWRLKEKGHKPDTSSILYDVSEEQKEKMLWDHSERLAIAFALLNTPPGTKIRITKNLRVCADCHTVTKLISKLMDREIVMRDNHRFHHFIDGICSCGDFW
ncbi:putative pentatricopeptide repeat-containing protein At3g11460, mitochondrial [Cucurbita pepo subsp. pepo]|uniref:putative pentatricopeptide repeat-containing protein At3g11460, mitochondrial n=1 Tax=Cucurbita pepo subsp. pepo TaxID=3664 RepID=UPI000C9D773E|nr:putative pentatricopeptide repeat-containing protein At3g11460, mitochondrial [Cucurbita pepo subsp. pepo]